MTEKDLDTLCLHLHELSLNDLQRLEDAGLIPSLRLGDTTEVEEAVCEIRSALEAVDSQEGRLRHLASLYCWLMPLNKLRSWALFYIGQSGLYPTRMPSKKPAMCPVVTRWQPPMDTRI
ncbi:uncharacterized protein [Dermacentor albipictus]|uniref:uncharacterized protein n=1 Tax=Dermacentor albipictus TaxID=60249 RepID=UPI0038FCDD8A